MIYENGKLSRILADVGYITLNSGGEPPMYHYFLTDHLGNNRVVMNERGAVEQVNHYYAFGGLMGESTGGEAQPYKYNGKELDRMHGLDWYDYGARHYDATLGRWTTMDPLAEKYYDISPYAYCGNNPVNYFDPDGKKKHNWLSDAPKKGHILDARHNNASFQKRFTNDLVQIWGEGVRDNPYQRSVSIDARIYPVYPTSGGAVGRQEVYPVDVNIKTASQLVKLLNKYDSNWRQSHGGKPIFIFHACATSDLAKEFSKSEELKDVIIIAPNAKLDTRLNGDEKVQDIATGENFKTKQEGRWEVYKNGETVRDSKGNPITYKNTDQPGTEGFNYRF